MLERLLLISIDCGIIGALTRRHNRRSGVLLVVALAGVKPSERPILVVLAVLALAGIKPSERFILVCLGFEKNQGSFPFPFLFGE